MKKELSILALEPFYGGSHKAFLDDWIKLSCHNWTLLTLPDRFWKWRMRHSAVELAGEVEELMQNGARWDIIFCSDMLNLAEFKGLVPYPVSALPTIAYFHENQLTYPVPKGGTLEIPAILSNFTTALAADRVWFNSEYNCNSFLDSLPAFFKRMPDLPPIDKIADIRAKSEIRPPGIKSFPKRKKREKGAVKILWAARWEHDKNPEDFFKAMKILKSENLAFTMDIIGEHSDRVPESFQQAKINFQNHIDKWGYLANRTEYEETLAEADIIVSSAIHEFFGIAILEGASAGAIPLMPQRLAYPSIFKDSKGQLLEQYFYDGTPEDLAKKIFSLADKIESNQEITDLQAEALEIASHFSWSTHAETLDKALLNTHDGRY